LAETERSSVIPIKPWRTNSTKTYGTVYFDPSCQAEAGTLFQHDGEEILLVLEGTMKFFHGGQEFIAEEGDCLYFDASVPHHGICQGKKEVKCLMVIYTPE
jgi:mannose-6-phosphate isomerase-like protein (cupin superfamily)